MQRKTPKSNVKAIRLILSFFYVGIGIFGILFRQDIAYLIYRNTDRTGFVLAGSIFPLLLGAGMLLYLYLRGEIDFPFLKRFVEAEPSYRFDDRTIVYDIDDLQLKVAELQKEIKQRSVNTEQLTPEQLGELVGDLKQQLQGVVAGDIVKTIEQKYSPQIAEGAQITQIRRGIDLTKARLAEEVKSLSRRNSVNLSIGAVTTGLAVGMLAYLVLGATQQTFGNVPDLLAHFIPRVSVAAFIEVFSFFFLKLYKAGLQEIKYFQNELTNVEMKSLAIEAALLPIQSGATERIIPQLVSVDRNVAGIAPLQSAEPTGNQISPKDVIALLEKFGKLVGSHS